MLRLDGKSEVIFEYPVTFDQGKMQINKVDLLYETRGLNGSYVLQIRKPQKKRSNRQNRVQWWYFNEIAKETGHTPMMIKGMCQYKFLLREIADPHTGEVIQYIADTSSLTTIEHNNFMEDVRNWAQGFFGLILPYPNDEI